jgi:hypothetical protein
MLELGFSHERTVVLLFLATSYNVELMFPFLAFGVKTLKSLFTEDIN